MQTAPRDPSAYPSAAPSPGSQSYAAFLEQNPAIGYLKIQASRARQAIPIPNLEIYVLQNFRDARVLFYHGFTDENGIIDSIALPAPPKAESLNPQDPEPGATYQVYATHPDFEPDLYEAEIFEGITAILPISPQLKKGAL